MTNYIEYIQGTSGTPVAIRDAETAGKVAVIESTLGAQSDAISTMEGVVTDVNGKVQFLEDTVNDAVDRVAGYLPLAGGTLTGDVLLVEGVHYGNELPEPGTVGRPFLKKV